MFDPNSPQALAISNLFIITLLIAAVIFLIVTGLVIYIAIRFRRREGEGEPRQNFGHTKLEIGWTVAPTLVLAVLFVLTIGGMREASPAVGEGRAPDIIVMADQWWWEVRYPASGVVTANEIHLPVGKRMLVHLESDDVIHDLWIPKLGRKMDVVPGHPNDVWLEADTRGIYQGACAEYCGVEHARMLVYAIAQPQTEFDAWLAAQSRPAPAIPTIGSVARGAQLFAQQTCISCHALNGTAAKAQVGPDLTHVASRLTLAAGTLTNTPANLAAWIKNPQQYKPGAKMPDLRLTDDQVQALVDYMETLK